MEEGTIIRIALPQADGKDKVRPALLLKIIPPFSDLLVCGLSTKLHNEIAGLDTRVDQSHPDFPTSGLKYPSLIRAAYLFTLSQGRNEGAIGFVSKDTFRQILKNLTSFILR